MTTATPGGAADGRRGATRRRTATTEALRHTGRHRGRRDLWGGLLLETGGGEAVFHEVGFAGFELVVGGCGVGAFAGGVGVLPPVRLFGGGEGAAGGGREVPVEGEGLPPPAVAAWAF